MGSPVKYVRTGNYDYIPYRLRLQRHSVLIPVFAFPHFRVPVPVPIPGEVLAGGQASQVSAPTTHRENFLLSASSEKAEYRGFPECRMPLLRCVCLEGFFFEKERVI